MTERIEYTRGGLEQEELDPNPFRQASAWLEEAKAGAMIEPTAMCLSTVANNGRPSSRMVLLRGIDESGLSFFTNYESRKGRELSQNSWACLCFWWGQLERQIRVEGKVERVSVAESEGYFNSRPYESRLASSASPQSEVVTSRKEIEDRMEDLRQNFPQNPPRPENWGGFRLVPDCFEFWQGRKARLHDRFRFRLTGAIWVVERLAP